MNVHVGWLSSPEAGVRRPVTAGTGKGDVVAVCDATGAEWFPAESTAHTHRFQPPAWVSSSWCGDRQVRARAWSGRPVVSSSWQAKPTVADPSWARWSVRRAACRLAPLGSPKDQVTLGLVPTSAAKGRNCAAGGGTASYR